MTSPRRWLGVILFPALLCTLWTSAWASELAPPGGGFALPLDCDFAADCLVQHYVDRDPSGGAQDYRCGGLTYDGHQGSDLRLRTWAMLDRGVAVLAAAAGVVRKAHDGEADSLTDPANPGRALTEINGNHLVIDHGAGWQTQYNHLRRGSLKVRTGDPVERGQALGLVGLSGNSNFPHLHFTVVHDYRVLDPFSAAPGDCTGTDRSLWHPAAAAQLSYRRGGILEAGFAAERPAPERIRSSAYAAVRRLPKETPMIAFWATAWGLQRGDRENLRLTGPDGQELADRQVILDDDHGETSSFVGVKRRDRDWPPGTYRGVYRVERQQDGQWVTLFQIGREIEVQ